MGSLSITWHESLIRNNDYDYDKLTMTLSYLILHSYYKCYMICGLWIVETALISDNFHSPQCQCDIHSQGHAFVTQSVYLVPFYNLTSHFMKDLFQTLRTLLIWCNCLSLFSLSILFIFQMNNLVNADNIITWIVLTSWLSKLSYCDLPALSLSHCHISSVSGSQAA